MLTPGPRDPAGFPQRAVGHVPTQGPGRCILGSGRARQQPGQGWTPSRRMPVVLMSCLLARSVPSGFWDL